MRGMALAAGCATVWPLLPAFPVRREWRGIFVSGCGGDTGRGVRELLSVAIARDPGGHLSGLTLYQQAGAVGPWVRWFADIACKAAATTKHLAERTNELIDGWQARLEGLRRDSAARNLAPLLVGHPVVSAHDAMSLLDISHYAARRALLTLEDRGILEPVRARSPGAGRNRQWYAATGLTQTWTP